jgi:hypothetical protein
MERARSEIKNMTETTRKELQEGTKRFSVVIVKKILGRKP